MTTYDRINTELYTDSVEWCPFESHQSSLLCGTYQLQESQKESSQETAKETQNVPQVRKGHLRQYKLDLSGSEPKLKLVNKQYMDGILDIKWCQNKHHDLMLFGLVNSIGQLQIWKFLDGESEPQKLCEADLDDKCLGLSLDWSNKQESEHQKVLASDSTGSVSIYELDNDHINCTSQWQAHDYEAWICGFNYWNSNIVYSGGDDCKFKCWDTRIGFDCPVFTKRFDMGVCSLQCNKIQTEHNIIAIGGYDEHLRLFDVRNWKRSLSDTRLDGGIWRIKWDPFSGKEILTATMYNGFHVLDASKLEDDLSIVINYKNDDHGSLGYGADWCFLDNPNSLIATGSFYDHSLHLWSSQIK